MFVFLAICKLPCRNNGKCVKPEQCLCPAGYTGRHCEYDVNECETEKPCDQMCHNTDGSYYCSCRLGFLLHSDRQSCKKIDTSFGNDDSDTAFEARDLENDVDNDDNLSARMNSIEKVRAKKTHMKKKTNEKSLQILLRLFPSPLFLLYNRTNVVMHTADDHRERTQRGDEQINAAHINDNESPEISIGWIG